MADAGYLRALSQLPLSYPAYLGFLYHPNLIPSSALGS
jgi:hypothetical protein